MKRKLTGILAADVVGYTRLVRADEEAALTALQAIRTELMEPTIKRRRGRIVKLMGDGLLAEFASIVDAVTCGVEIQTAMAERSPSKMNIVLRIGINLGDVVIDGEDILGDGVNLASRLEGISAPGGICVSDAVYEQVRHRLDLGFESAGSQRLKNIDNPVHVWTWSPSDPDLDHTTESETDTLQANSNDAVTRKPTIAVLPFVDRSLATGANPIGEAICEGVIAGLSKFSEISVTAWNSSKKLDPVLQPNAVLGEALGVHYLLTGAQQISGQKLRINVKLQRASNDEVLWANNYDRSLDDGFEMQDEIAAAVSARVGAIIAFQPLSDSEPGLNKALQYHLRARKEFRKLTRDGNLEALRLNNLAVKTDSESAFGYIGLCFVYAQGFITGWIDVDRAEAKRSAERASAKALELEPDNYDCFFSTAWMHSVFGEHDAAIRRYKQAIEMNPSASNAIANLAEAYIFAGRYEDAAQTFQRIMKSDPKHRTWWHHGLAWALWFGGDHPGALRAALETSEATPEVKLKLAGMYQSLGHVDRAKTEISLALSQDPHLSVSRLRREFQHRFFIQADLENWLALLSLAGLPE